MIDILNAVPTDGLPAVEAACAEALSHSVHSADVVLNILARQREPAPPANIMTPAALTLRHAAIACTATSLRSATTVGVSKAATMFKQPALAPSPQPRPAPTTRALPTERAD